MTLDVNGRAWQIEWDHARFPPRPLMLPSGRETWVHGATTCMIVPADAVDPDDILAAGYLGVAWCSAEDAFVKATGRKIALTEALQSWGITREQRREVWDAYHGRA